MVSADVGENRRRDQLLQEKWDHVNNVVIKLNKQLLQQSQHCRDEKIRKQRFPPFDFFVRTKCVSADMCMPCIFLLL